MKPLLCVGNTRKSLLEILSKLGNSIKLYELV